MQDFRRLAVWRKAHQVALDVYRTTRQFPKDETFGLRAQVRRSACSTPANIAEGCGRGGDADFARFLQMAMGSASETEYHLLLARDLEMLKNTEHKRLHDEVVEVKRMLASLLKTVRAAK